MNWVHLQGLRVAWLFFLSKPVMKKILLSVSTFCWMLLGSSCSSDPEVSKTPQEEITELRVMSYNILYSTSNESTLNVLEETSADLIGLQETSAARLADLAQRLRFYYHNFKKSTGNMSDQDTGILSRFPIVRFFDNGVVVKISEELKVAIFSVHLAPYPYEPYDFRDNKITTSEQAIASATRVRIPQINPVLEEIKSLLNEGIPVFLTGDFNEPSALDWTAITAEKKMHFGKAVQWPVSIAVNNTGLIDAYRFKFPDPVAQPGNTWTTWESANEVYDRIDMIYHSENDIFELNNIKLVGGPQDAAGLIVEDYASDHYSVLATYKVNF
jgi:endonuclease/exonuclease/phosphatase family metal-dependent hydrolase